MSHCKRPKWPPVSEHNLSGPFSFLLIYWSSDETNVCHLYQPFFHVTNWCVQIIPHPGESHPPKSKLFTEVRRKLWYVGRTLCCQLWAPGVNSSAQPASTALLLKCEMCCCYRCCWIVITGVCWTALLVLAWRYVSDAPMHLCCLSTPVSQKARNQPWIWSQRRTIKKLETECCQLDFLCSAQATWPKEGSYAVISLYLILQKVNSKWKHGSFVTFLWLFTKTAGAQELV